MKTRFFAASLLLLPIFALGEELTVADREALLEKLNQIKEAADQKVDAKFRLAVAAYRSAMTDPDAAVELYVKCVQKENFLDLEKKESEFRDWKKKESGRLKNPAFGRALCHQLRWLVLSLRAASEKTDHMELAADAQEAMEAVFRDAAALEGQHGLLSQSVMGSIFAQAYDIGSIRAKDFPGSPVRIAEVFEKMIYPEIRAKKDVDRLRAAWQRRIQLEGVLITWTEKSAEKDTPFGKAAGPTPAQQHFSEESLPDLQWQMEKDLFAAGDERGACVRMMALIEGNPTHPSAKRWTEDLRAQITPQPKETPLKPEDAAAES